MKIAIGNIKHLKVKNAKHSKNNSMTNYNSDHNFHFIIETTNILSFHWNDTENTYQKLTLAFQI